MKRILLLFLSFLMVVAAIGCREGGRTEPVGTADVTEPSVTPTPYLPDERGLMPVYFDSEDQLLETIRKLREKPDERIVIDSAYFERQTYHWSADDNNIAALDAFYASDINKATVKLAYIAVTKESVVFHYSDFSGDKIGREMNFIWWRLMSPETAMNVSGTHETVYRDGIVYKIKKSEESCHVTWVEDGRPYGAFFQDEPERAEIFRFCRARRIAVDP